jgi:hypothetical protein
MGNPSRGSQAPGGARGANQALIVIFERDESLAGLLLSHLRAQGYEGRSARTPVEVFDLIARYPVRLALVNLGQAATSRREFWVALDAQRLGRGVQVITYRYLVPGVEVDLSDGSGRPDVEVRGPQGLGALLEAVRAKLPPPARETPDSTFLVGSGPPGFPASNQPPVAQPVSPAMSPARSVPEHPVISPARSVPEHPGWQPSISGILNLSRGMQAGQPPEFMPLSGGSGGSMNPAQGGWAPEINRMPPMPAGPPLPMNGANEQRAPQWTNGHAEPPAMPAEAGGPGWPSLSPGPEPPGNSQMNGASSRAPGAGDFPGGMPFHPSLPMGDLAALSDAINALAAAGVPGYQQAAAAAAASAMNAAPPPRREPDPWERGQSHVVPERGPRPGAGAGNTYPVSAPPGMPEERYASAPPGMPEERYASAPPGMPEERYASAPPGVPEERRPSGSMGGMTQMNQMNQGAQPAPRGAAETLYMGQQAFAELGRAEEARQQDTRSRALAGNGDEYEYPPRERAAATQRNGDQPTVTPSRRLAEEMGSLASGDPPASYQSQIRAPIVATGQIERSLGHVLVEGQLVSQQRLEVALGIQRLLRGADIDYRLGEVLLLFKFLTRDQLLAALLVSRGLVTPAQVASIGRIKQELHAIGMEYDLENLLILFRMLTSEQLREIRSEFP